MGRMDTTVAQYTLSSISDTCRGVVSETEKSAGDSIANLADARSRDVFSARRGGVSAKMSGLRRWGSRMASQAAKPSQIIL